MTRRWFTLPTLTLLLCSASLVFAPPLAAAPTVTPADVTGRGPGTWNLSGCPLGGGANITSFDETYDASAAVGKVTLHVCAPVVNLPQPPGTFTLTTASGTLTGTAAVLHVIDTVSTVPFHLALTITSGTGALSSVSGPLVLMVATDASVSFSGPTFGVVALADDTTPPSCRLTSITAGPPKRLTVTVRDTASGLWHVFETKLVNATQSGPVFATGTTDSVTITATKVDPALPSVLSLTVRDVAGNTTSCDPVLATVGAGRAGAVHVARVDAADHVVTFDNHRPGLARVVVDVNGVRFRARLRAGHTTPIDVARAMQPGDANRVSVVGHGRRGATADVVIWPGA